MLMRRAFAVVCLLTTCRNRATGSVMVSREKREKILVLRGILTKITVSRDRQEEKYCGKGNSKGPMLPMVLCCPDHSAPVFRTEQMRLFEERRDRNRSESRPEGEKEIQRKNGRKTRKEQDMY